MLGDHRLIRWYRRKARLLGWSIWTGMRARKSTMARILPPLDAADEARYRAENPALIAECLDRADAVAGGEFPALSAGTAQWRGPDFWKKHPLTKAGLPGGFHPYNAEHYMGGDINTAMWVASLPFLPTLAQAYRLSGDEIYTKTISEAVESWFGAENPARNPGWDADLAVSMRAVSILYALSLLPEGAPLAGRQTAGRIVMLSGHVLEGMVEKPSFNHWIINAFGLFCCGLAAKESARGKRWIRKGAAILEQEIERQFFADGVHGERSPGYMRLVLEVYLNFRVLGQHHGMPFTPEFDSRLVHACEALAQLCDRGAAPANFGDDSGLYLQSDQTAVAPLALAAVLFARQDFKAHVKAFPLAAFWLQGGSGYREFLALGQQRRAPRSFALADSGYYAAQTDSGALKLTCGTELTAANGHSHADVLGFELEIEGDRVLADAGTYAYYPSRQWRDYFRSTRAHNTVAVDGEDQAVPFPDDHFGWKRYPRVRVHQWSSDESRDLFDAEHDGYQRLKQPVIHRRRVLYVKPDYWVIVDDLLGEGEHLCELCFQFAPGELRLEDNGNAVARRPWGNLELRQLAEGCEVDIVTGQEQPIRGWVSSGYGHKEPAPSLRYARHASLPFRFCTVVVPVRADEQISAQRTGEGIEVAAGRFIDQIRIPEDVLADAAITLERVVPAAALPGGRR